MDQRSKDIQQRFEWPIVIAAFLVIPQLVIEESNFGEPWAASLIGPGTGTRDKSVSAFQDSR